MSLKVAKEPHCVEICRVWLKERMGGGEEWFRQDVKDDRGKMENSSPLRLKQIF